ncbi:hypothetical protein F2Q68_00023823 [Brassica cretica]|uniref:MATH domain-containing protein n=1 Tax=Brassica cretica TaxID=69181 RepID=A0A8S9IBN4_BRACR|nr:hypothetical protein F2Q68_00023823 [Brassica cretica]
MWSQNPSFRFEIEKFWKKKKKGDHISSKVFVAGGCGWDIFTLMITLLCTCEVANPKSLPIGWKRNVNFYFTALNHCNIERCRSNIVESKVLDAETSSWGFPKAFRRSQLKEKWFMGNDSLSIEVYINVIEAVDGESDDVSEKGLPISTVFRFLLLRVQQFEESVKKLEMMVSVLKAKLDQEKAKTASDDFLLL